MANGGQGVVSGLEGVWFADNYASRKLEKCHSFLPSPVHARPCRGPWVMLSMYGQKRVSNAIIGTRQLGEKTPTENIVPSGLLGGWAWG